MKGVPASVQEKLSFSTCYYFPVARRIHVGTAGYDYTDWVGDDRFYPPSVAANRRDLLTYYASQFSFVELNFTYYTETSPKQLEGMLEHVRPDRPLSLIEGTYAPRPDFRFAIKAYRNLTHQIDEDFAAVAQKFQQDITPLADADKLAAVVFQFPPSFRPSQDAAVYLEALHELFTEMPHIFEFRQRAWYREEAVELVGKYRVPFCWVDAPFMANLPRFFFPLTGDFFYARFHGRNETDWWKRDEEDASARYHYRYREGELEKLAEAIIESGAERGYAIFNNHPVADAPKNARQLEMILTKLDKAEEAS